MHILVIPSFLPPYGGQFAIDQASALQRLGHEVRILHCQQLGATIYPWHYLTAPYKRWWEKESDIDIYRTNFRGIPKNIHINQSRYCSILYDMFGEYVKKHGQPDIIHAHAAKWAGVAAMQISSKTAIPYFVTEHIPRGSYEVDFGKGWSHDIWAKDLIKECYSHASCVIPVAQELVDDTSCFFGKDYTYVSLSNIIDTDFYSYTDRSSLTGRPFRICCLAIANKEQFFRKGYDILAEAFYDIPNCELHIAGRDTDSRRFRKLFEQYHGQPIDDKKIIIHGNLDKHAVRNLLYHCDALVLPSRSEVQPLVILEAMSTGIPVVSTEVTPQSERIPHACIITPIADASALHEAMKQVMSIHPSQEISQHIKTLASSQVIAHKLEQLFTTCSSAPV